MIMSRTHQVDYEGNPMIAPVLYGAAQRITLTIELNARKLRFCLESGGAGWGGARAEVGCRVGGGVMTFTVWPCCQCCQIFLCGAGFGCVSGCAA